ncbi:MAG: alpha/beta fold hydrolase [Planctomycetota bacterium]
MIDPFPFRTNYLTVNSHRMHYLDEGQGDPVVMVHGNPTWCYYYRNLVAALRGSYRAVALDHIGCGFSDKPDDRHYSYTLRQRADDLETVLDALDIRQRITLVVHDWGGMIGMTYAVRHAERIARIVVLNTGAFHLPKGKAFPWPLWISRNTWIGAFLIRGFNAFSRIAARVCVRRAPMPAEVRRFYCMPYDSWKNRIATLRFVQDIPLTPRDAGYGLVTQVEQGLHAFNDTPMLICWGMKDFVFDHHFLDEWIRRMPKAEVHRFPLCGHYILEDAGREIIPLIQRFLENHPLEGAPS